MVFNAFLFFFRPLSRGQFRVFRSLGQRTLSFIVKHHAIYVHCCKILFTSSTSPLIMSTIVRPIFYYNTMINLPSNHGISHRHIRTMAILCHVIQQTHTLIYSQIKRQSTSEHPPSKLVRHVMPPVPLAIHQPWVASRFISRSVSMRPKTNAEGGHGRRITLLCVSTPSPTLRSSWRSPLFLVARH